MKILVDRDLMVEIATMLEQMIRKNPRNKEELQRRLNEIEEAFADNLKPINPSIGDIKILTSDAIKEGTCVFISTLTDTSRIRKMLIEQYQDTKNENIS